MSTMESAVTAGDSSGTDLDTPAGPDVGTSTEPDPRSDPAANPVFAGPDARRRNRTVSTLQLSGGLAIVAVTVLAVLWYVPGIIRSDSHSFTGTVVSNGITNLNFASSGLVGRIQVHLGQAVKTGQVLATDTSSSTTKSLSADRASIAASQATLAALRAEPVTPTTSASIAAANAQLAKGEAQLSADKVTLSEAQIVAPTGGTVIAINAQPGETVTSAGVWSYSAVPQAANSQTPPFSLLPEGPTTTLKTRQHPDRTAHDRATHVHQLGGHHAGPREPHLVGPARAGSHHLGSRGPGGRCAAWSARWHPPRSAPRPAPPTRSRSALPAASRPRHSTG